MLPLFGQAYSSVKKTIALFSILFFFVIHLANAQNPVLKDPNSPDVPSLPTQLPPAQLYDLL